MTFPYVKPDDLCEFSFVGGTYETLVFDIIDSASAAVDLSSATCTWTMGEYGSGSAQISKSGSISASPVNRFTVTLDASDTISFQGKYMHQPIIEDLSGNVFRPSQGIINIWPANQ